MLGSGHNPKRGLAKDGVALLVGSILRLKLGRVTAAGRLLANAFGTTYMKSLVAYLAHEQLRQRRRLRRVARALQTAVDDEDWLQGRRQCGLGRQFWPHRAAGDVVQKAVLRCGPSKADCEKMRLVKLIAFYTAHLILAGRYEALQQPANCSLRSSCSFRDALE